MRRALRFVLAVIIILLAASGGLLGALLFLDSPLDAGSGDSVPFTITRGESLLSVASRLETEKLIRSSRFLVGLSKIRGTETLFQAGSYLVPKGKTARQIHDFFISGSQVLHRITIPEGWTLSRVASYFAEKTITSREDFLGAAKNPELLDRLNIPADSAEGYLFPDTYLFPVDFPAEKIVTRLVDNFFLKIREIYPGFGEISPEEFHRKVTLASIIEREYRDPAEAPLMASVFYNRLKVNMNLGSCATVEYIITEIQGKPHPDIITYRDLEIPSPYNTYRRSGLPPGPISNPGRTALGAAFYPAETDYWYFVLKDAAAGTHFFSKSLQEHNRARVLYVKKISSGN